MALKIRTTSRLGGMQRLVSQGHGAAAGCTLASLHQLPGGTIAVRFELANIRVDGAATYNAVYALSAGVNDWITPLNQAGVPDDAMWVPVTADGSPDMTVPAALTASRPARRLTDIMPFTAIPPVRVDGGDGICLFFRIFAAAGSVTYHDFSGTVGIWNGYNNGQHPGQFSQTFGGGWLHFANHCREGNLAVAYNPRLLHAQVVPHSVLPVTAMPTLTIMSVGDSILSGESAKGFVDGGINGAGLQIAKALNQPRRTASHVNEAMSGATSADYIANAHATLDVMPPDIILLQTWSANDPEATTSRAIWNAWRDTMTFAARAVAEGCDVILVTSPPFCGAGSFRHANDWEAARCQANDLVKDSGLNYLDSDAILGIGRDPVSYRDGCSDDKVHPNELGASRLASAALTLLREHGFVANAQPLSPAGANPAPAPAHDWRGTGERPSASARRFTIHTAHGTIVYADFASGRLRHASAETAPRNLVLLPEGSAARLVRIGDAGELFIVRVRPEGKFSAHRADPAPAGDGFVSRFEIVGADPARFGLRGAGLYLCAEGGGDIALNRMDQDLWETFRIESAEA